MKLEHGQVGQLRCWRPSWRLGRDTMFDVFLIFGIDEDTRKAHILSNGGPEYVTLASILQGSEVINEAG